MNDSKPETTGDLSALPIDQYPSLIDLLDMDIRDTGERPPRKPHWLIARHQRDYDRAQAAELLTNAGYTLTPPEPEPMTPEQQAEHDHWQTAYQDYNRSHPITWPTRIDVRDNGLNDLTVRELQPANPYASLTPNHRGPVIRHRRDALDAQ